MPPEFEPVRLVTDDIPERYRDEMIRDFYGRIAMRMQVAPISDDPMRIDAVTHLLPGVAVSSGAVSSTSGERTPDLLSDGMDDLYLSTATGGYLVSVKDREVAQASSDELVVTSLCHPTRFLMPAGSLKTVQIRRSIIAPLVEAIDDPPVRTVSMARPEARLLFNYVDTLAHVDVSTPELRQTVANHMRDLAALIIGATRDAGEMARLGGVRAARLQQILAEIKAGFANPDFSALSVARKLSLSPRYVQDLLHDTGASFSERVMELRLQKARVMLEDRRNLGLKVSAIAYACGFGDISYFNQCFRRRFGASPTQFRGT